MHSHRLIIIGLLSITSLRCAWIDKPIGIPQEDNNCYIAAPVQALLAVGPLADLVVSKNNDYFPKELPNLRAFQQIAKAYKKASDSGKEYLEYGGLASAEKVCGHAGEFGNAYNVALNPLLKELISNEELQSFFMLNYIKTTTGKNEQHRARDFTPTKFSFSEIYNLTTIHKLTKPYPRFVIFRGQSQYYDEIPRGMVPDIAAKERVFNEAYRDRHLATPFPLTADGYTLKALILHSYPRGHFYALVKYGTQWYDMDALAQPKPWRKEVSNKEIEQLSKQGYYKPSKEPIGSVPYALIYERMKDKSGLTELTSNLHLLEIAAGSGNVKFKNYHHLSYS